MSSTSHQRHNHEDHTDPISQKEHVENAKIVDHVHPVHPPGEDSSDALRIAGLRITKHRRMAYAILREAHQPLSTEAVYLALKAEDSTVNLSTVYRLLEAFHGKGLVDKASTSEDGKILYELASSVHRHHLHCLSCHHITVVEGCPLEGYEKQLEQTTRFHVTGHKLEMTGYCIDCQEKPT